jgi:hypothetical protein
MITLNFLCSKSDHHKIVANMTKGFKECNISHVINGKIKDYEYTYSISTFIDTTKYPMKKFIFGPQFTDFTKFTTNHAKNSIYIQPSSPSIDIRKALGFTTLQMKSYCVGIDTDEFKPGKRNGLPFVYVKNRKPEDIELVYSYLAKKKIQYHKIIYGSYNENAYKNILNSAPYGIWIGRNESQGIAVQEALSCNVPLFVWNISKRGDEYPLSKTKEPVKHMFATSVPYWDKCCGELVYTFAEFAESFDTFISTLNTYYPRTFIINNLSLSKRATVFPTLFQTIPSYRYDFYLIWNHGMSKLDEIRAIINTNPCLTIKKESLHNVKNIANFIKTLYILDVKNQKHIANKTKYLLTQPPNVHLFILKNTSASPEESLNETKWKIRERFNPKFKDSTYQPHTRLSPGITHEHVIHGSDIEEETLHILKILNIRI